MISEAVRAAYIELTNIVEVSDLALTINDLDMNAIRDVISDLELEFPELNDTPEPDEGGESDDAFALMSAGHGTDEDYGGCCDH